MRRHPSALPLLFAALAWTGHARAQEPEPAVADVVPPAIQTRVEPVFPTGTEPREAEVVVTVLVDKDGHVAEAKVAQSAGAAFDDAALGAVQKWTFAPARRGATAIASRVRIALHFHAAAPAPEFSSPTVDVNPPRIAGARQQAPSPAAPPAAPEDTETVNVWGRSHLPSRGSGDFDVPVGKLAAVPHADAASLLRLAPGVMLTNLGGLGHPYQIFLRGFDAREGQDIEFTADGVPMNDVGNPHGNGLADTHFVIPEVVRSLRVVEGPFSPQQANFAVAGSALYDLGIEEPGLTTRVSYGSFNTRRLLVLAHPRGCSDKTFAAGELLAQDGFGQNRSGERGSAIGGWEGHLGKASLRLLATSYAAHYKAAGVLREDDVAAGRKNFGDTYDTGQGGDSARHSVQLSIAEKLGDFRVQQSVFGILRDSKMRENLTGFTEDPQQAWQSVHPQRGDLTDQQARSGTLGGRGAARLALTAFGKRRQEIEVGYYARYDAVDALQQRDRAGTAIPYRRDLDLWSGTTDLAAYVDGNLHPLPWVTVRGGLRADYFHYAITDRCAVTAPPTISSSAPDTECFSADRQGYRSPDQTGTTGSPIAQPRATLLVGPWDGVSFSGSLGLGSRSIDPAYVNQDLGTPFATALAWEGGAAYRRTHGSVDLTARSVFFETKVDRDQLFNASAGRPTLASGTSRAGWQASARATGRFFDVAASVTLVRASFDDTGLRVPYSPPVTARLDGALFGPLARVGGHRLAGTVGAGLSVVGPRPLPLGETASGYALVDVGGTLKWRGVDLGIVCTNLFDARYHIAELNYVSDFHTQPYPTRVQSRTFVAGEPLAFNVTLGFTFGGDEP